MLGRRPQRAGGRGQCGRGEPLAAHRARRRRRAGTSARSGRPQSRAVSSSRSGRAGARRGRSSDRVQRRVDVEVAAPVGRHEPRPRRAGRGPGGPTGTGRGPARAASRRACARSASSVACTRSATSASVRVRVRGQRPGRSACSSSTPDLRGDLGEARRAGPASDRPTVRCAPRRAWGCCAAGAGPPAGRGGGLRLPPGRTPSGRRRSVGRLGAEHLPRRARGRPPRAAGRPDSCSRIRPDSATSAASSPACQSRGRHAAQLGQPRRRSPTRSIAPRTDEPTRTSGCSRVRRTSSTTCARHPASAAGAAQRDDLPLGRRRTGSPSRSGRCGRRSPRRSARCRPRRTGSSRRPAGSPAPARPGRAAGTVQLALGHHRDQDVERLLGDPVELLDVEQPAVAQRGDQRPVDEDVRAGSPRRAPGPGRSARPAAPGVSSALPSTKCERHRRGAAATARSSVRLARAGRTLEERRARRRRARPRSSSTSRARSEDAGPGRVTRRTQCSCECTTTPRTFLPASRSS